MLYKLGLSYKRQEYHKTEILKETQGLLDKHRGHTQASFNEVNEFIQTFHSDFGDYVTTMKKERLD